MKLFKFTRMVADCQTMAIEAESIEDALERIDDDGYEWESTPVETAPWQEAQWDESEEGSAFRTWSDIHELNEIYMLLPRSFLELARDTYKDRLANGEKDEDFANPLGPALAELGYLPK